MPLIPFDPDETDAEEENTEVTLTGIDIFGGDREQILQALKLNRKMLHDPQPDAEVDEAAVRTTIDDLLDQLNAPSET